MTDPSSNGGLQQRESGWEGENFINWTFSYQWKIFPLFAMEKVDGEGGMLIFTWVAIIWSFMIIKKRLLLWELVWITFHNEYFRR